MIVNRQKAVGINLPGLRRFGRRLRRVLRLGRQDFNVCFVDDREIQRLNSTYRGKPHPTDVLSFPWKPAAEPTSRRDRTREFRGFLGDIVISVEAARRNARAEGHSTLDEIRWLILHGVLHLLGYDHETDRGEMTALELSLRERLEIDGGSQLLPRAGRDILRLPRIEVRTRGEAAPGWMLKRSLSRSEGRG